jgi:hypothetical protein
VGFLSLSGEWVVVGGFLKVREEISGVVCVEMGWVGVRMEWVGAKMVWVGVRMEWVGVEVV